MTAAAFQATYSDFKLIRTRKCVQLIFEIPLENANLALTVLGGMPNPAADVWCGIARLEPSQVANGGDVSQVPTDTSASGSSGRPPQRLVQQAAMMCRRADFRVFLEETFQNLIPDGCKINTEEQAADVVRFLCDVESRKELLTGSPPGDRWDELYGKYACWRAAPELLK